VALLIFVRLKDYAERRLMARHTWRRGMSPLLALLINFKVERCAQLQETVLVQEEVVGGTPVGS
jgi:hypothetical protein